ncbi:hypothetical protein EVAR_79781_1, partial [Eumeta japonica]
SPHGPVYAGGVVGTQTATEQRTNRRRRIRNYIQTRSISFSQP